MKTETVLDAIEMARLLAAGIFQTCVVTAMRVVSSRLFVMGNALPRAGPWKTVDGLELATLGWVHWHNTGQRHGYLGDVPPTEFEESFYSGVTSAQELVEIK